MKNSNSKFSNYQIIVIVLLALTQFTVILDFMVMSPLGDMLMKHMSLSTKQFGIAVSAYAFSAGISGLLTAGFADKYDRKKLLLSFYVGFIVGTLFCALSPNYYALVSARIFTGIFGGVIGSINLAILTDIFPIEKRGRAMGYVQMAFGSSQVLGIPISLFLANEWGWHFPFVMIVGLASIIFILITWKLKPLTSHLKFEKKVSSMQHLWNVLRNRNYRIGFFTTSLISIGGFMMMPWGSAFAINNLSVTEAELPFIFMVSGVFSLIFMPLIGKLSDSLNKFYLYIFASMWLSVVVMIYTNLSNISLVLVMTMNVCMMFGITSRMIPSMTLISALPELKDRGAFMSINASLQQIAGGIAAAIGGIIVTQKTKTSPIENYDLVGYFVVIVSVLSVFMLFRVNKIINSKINS